MTSSKIEMPGEVKADPAALMASLHLLPSPTPNLEIKYTKVRLRKGLPSTETFWNLLSSPWSVGEGGATGSGAGVSPARLSSSRSIRDTLTSGLGFLESFGVLGASGTRPSLSRGSEGQRLFPKPHLPPPSGPILRVGSYCCGKGVGFDSSNWEEAFLARLAMQSGSRSLLSGLPSGAGRVLCSPLGALRAAFP